MTLQSAGKLSLSVAEVDDQAYGLSSEARADDVGELRIIWDSISVDLDVLDDRLDVGVRAQFVSRAVHEYDGSAFLGALQLNDTATKKTVGEYYYTVKQVTDENFGISIFQSNSVRVVFDRIEIDLDAEPSRRLANRMAADKALWLLERVDELFL